MDKAEIDAALDELLTTKKAARARINELNEQIDQWRKRLSEIQDEIEDLRTQADADLPRVLVAYRRAWLSDPRAQKEWVAVRATRSSVWARPIGSNQKPERFRRPRRGKWPWISGTAPGGRKMTHECACAAVAALAPEEG